jgi:hypothetical protein
VLASTIVDMRLLLSLVLVVTLGVYTPANAEPAPKALVLIDTGFDTAIEAISKSVIFESCVMDWSMCPNSRTFQEGTGAATISSSLLTAPGISHGTQMASIAVSTNPSQKIILLRLVAYNSRGQRLPVYESSLIQAFQWITAKQQELNIGAVAMAQGHHSFEAVKNYCPKSPRVEKLIIDLKVNDVPVFLPAGNAGDKVRIDWPACIPAAIAIGALDANGQIAKYSNYDRVLNDFYVLGTSPALLPGGGSTTATGTSVSTVVAASYWLKIKELKPDMKLADISQLFRSTGPIVFDSKFRYGRKMDIEAAMNLLLSIPTP